MPAGSCRFQIGSIGCTALSDGYFSCPTQWFFPNADSERLSQALASRRLPREQVLSPYTCLLIETGRHVLLVDTGAGELHATSGAIRARLEMEGIRPKDVDTVVLTHAHPDHAGGMVDLQGRPAFPSARYVLCEREWDFWMNPRSDLSGLRLPDDYKSKARTTARTCLEAVRHHIEPLDREAEIVPGVRVVPAPGHTPGHLALLITSGGESLMNIGDAAGHPLHLEEPGWENGFDLIPSAAAATRCTLLERAVSEKMRVMAFHFPFPSVGRVSARAEGGWKWEPGC